LSVDRQIPTIQFEIERTIVDAFDESRSQFSVHCDTATDDFANDTLGFRR